MNRIARLADIAGRRFAQVNGGEHLMDYSNYHARCQYPHCPFDAPGPTGDEELAVHLASGVHADEPRRHVEKYKTTAYRVFDHVTGEQVLVTLDAAEAKRKAAELDD